MYNTPQKVLIVTTKASQTVRRIYILNLRHTSFDTYYLPTEPTWFDTTVAAVAIAYAGSVAFAVVLGGITWFATEVFLAVRARAILASNAYND